MRYQAALRPDMTSSVDSKVPPNFVSTPNPIFGLALTKPCHHPLLHSDRDRMRTLLPIMQTSSQRCSPKLISFFHYPARSWTQFRNSSAFVSLLRRAPKGPRQIDKKITAWLGQAQSVVVRIAGIRQKIRVPTVQHIIQSTLSMKARCAITESKIEDGVAGRHLFMLVGVYMVLAPGYNA